MVTITIAIVAVSGVILPIIIQTIQSRTFRNEQKTLQNNIDSAVAEKTTQLENAVEAKFATAKSDFDASVKRATDALQRRLEQQILATKGTSFHIQAAAEADKQHLADAARDYAIAAELYFRGGDELNGQRTLRELQDTCLSAVSRDQLDAVPQAEKEIAQLLSVLRPRNNQGRFEDAINNIEAALVRIRKAPALVGPPAPPKP